MRTGTVAQSLLRAVAGQLIQASRARQIERSIIRSVTPELGGLHAPPTVGRARPALAGAAPRGSVSARARRGARPPLPLARSGAAEAPADGRGRRRLDARARPRPVVARRRLPRGARPLRVRAVRDLGLAKLASALWGRWVEPEETDVLLAPYGEWGGLASVYLLAGFYRGLVPLPRVAAA